MKNGYDGVEMKVVNKYHYLGFAFTTTLSVKQGTDHLVAKGKKAVLNLCTSFHKCRGMTKETFFKIFDSKIQSVLLYSSEWYMKQGSRSLQKIA